MAPPLGPLGPILAAGLLAGGAAALRREGGGGSLGHSAGAGNISGYLRGPFWKAWYARQTHPRFPNGTRIPEVKHRRTDPEVHLIRIQKTGSTTFGERIMQHFCGIESRWCQYLLHSEWQASVNNGRYHGKLVVFLRHPVERTVSEFLFLRTPDGYYVTDQPQWDFHNTRWLREVQEERSTERAFANFLQGFSGTPSRNRQALYLLGWDRLAEEAPGRLYDWEGNHSGLVELAKERLRKTLLGITDCFEKSVEVITESLGWNTTEALSLAATAPSRKPEAHEHEQAERINSELLASVLNQSLVEQVSSAWNHSRPNGTWRSRLSPKLVNYLENWNAVDMELYEYALKLFQERYNQTCV
mmetsp:Transcript_27051/g.84167  ORF Transcript_27051/g.84167 Transcript_27051/m.84167 type:complete len:358 (+) Transcript_27051:75-1148(+)|eukprot:CAMPEP_0204586384 /NCGR_PEP_ID=MMETSP0661-20131031/47456_1 /ASSEMBLY_ACC=CAM_ASM_000606 /TAXON_ID=109239 /ORGANISM="Alexandrium margalefi, Strain AMGDE01CS-322" /LENGTH=357 /DNA_ID=CAMNT_0051596017 /DNA_START=69 /DNA_END=1142 /DNA_ORIENTATION=-